MTTNHVMPPIAVVGVAALFPGEPWTEGFWRTIVNGRDCLTDVPPSHWLIRDYYDPNPAAPVKTYARRGAFLSPVAFDPLDHGIPPSVIPSTDTAQLLALVAARQLLEQGALLDRIPRDRIAVILGVASATELVSTMSGSLQRPVLERVLQESQLPADQIAAICDRVAQHYVGWTESTFPGLLGNVVAGRIANRFDLGGTNCVVDAACASSLAALKMAIHELSVGAPDMVITGGVDALNDIFMFMCFSKTPAMSPTGDCRPFAEDADGTMLGEGIGLFALRRLEDAERDGNEIYAVLRGLGGSSDGRATSIYAPRAEGQAKALRRAYEAAGYGPETVDLVEAHGTATTAGDAAELRALTDVFGETRTGTWCALGSIKSQIGHTKAAAGAASLYKALMALHHKVLPPTIKIRQPNPSLESSTSPFYLNTEARPWIRPPDHPRRASVSSFGFGGSNFHLTLEEYTGPSRRPSRIRTVETELFLFGGEAPELVLRDARSAAELASTARSFGPTARRTQTTFAVGAPYRLAIVARTAADLAAKIDQAAAALRKADHEVWIPTGVAYGTGPAPEGKTTFLFPGQGSHYLGMSGALAMAFDAARRRWDEAADVAAVVFPPPVFADADRSAQRTRLTDTRWAQPAIGVTSHIYLDLLRAAGLRPDSCAGHSFGEVTALMCGGVLSAPDFLRIARCRGALMADAASRLPGAMLAVDAAATDPEIESLLRAFDADIVVANVNSPRQIVLAGRTEQIHVAAGRLAAQGRTTRILPVSTAFHSPIVQTASPALLAFLESIDFGAPRIPVYSNVTARPYLAAADHGRALLSQQLAVPVRFADQIAALYADGTRLFIEVGPGSILTDLTAACLEGRPHVAIATDSKRKSAVTALWLAFARLAAVGIPFNLDFAWKDYDSRLEAPPNGAPTAVLISGSNFGKKYPVAGIEESRTAPAATVAARPRDVPPPGPTPTVEDTPARDHDRHATVRLIQEKMADAHAAAQRAMTESHIAYLTASEALLTSLLQPGGIPIRLPVPVSPPPESAAASHAASALPDVLSTELTPSPALAVEQLEAPNGTRTIASLSDRVLEVIARHTGYPVDILGPEMDLEADLGIDSIKRVQILAAIGDARADLPVVDASALAGLRTIGAIVAYLGGDNGDGSAASAIKRIGLRAVASPAGTSDTSTLTSLDKVAIVGCRAEIGQALAVRLNGRGVNASVYPQIPPDASGTIVLDFDDEGDDPVTHALQMFAAAKGFVASNGARGGALILVQGCGSAWRGGVPGLAKTLALEHAGCAVRVIEVERGAHSSSQIADTIAEEILVAGAPSELTIDARGHRMIWEEVERPFRDLDGDMLAGRPVIVASGGARGVTAACLIALARVAPLRLALVGRTPLMPDPAEAEGVEDAAALNARLLAAARARGQAMTAGDLRAHVQAIQKNREIRRTLESLDGLGSETIYLAADVADEAATAAALEQVRHRWGRIAMLIHGAGIIADRRIEDKTPEQVAQVVGAKLLGLQSLLCATDADELKMICIFSSVAGRYGNAGQSDYALANAAMSRIARHEAARRGDRCVVRCLGWGPWAAGMVTPELQAHFEARGIPLIREEAGTAAFVRELQYASSDPADVDVVLIPRQPDLAD